MERKLFIIPDPLLPLDSTLDGTYATAFITLAGLFPTINAVIGTFSPILSLILPATFIFLFIQLMYSVHQKRIKHKEDETLYRNRISAIEGLLYQIDNSAKWEDGRFSFTINEDLFWFADDEDRSVFQKFRASTLRSDNWYADSRDIFLELIARQNTRFQIAHHNLTSPNEAKSLYNQLLRHEKQQYFQSSSS